MHSCSVRHNRRDPLGPQPPSELPTVRLQLFCSGAPRETRTVAGPVFLIGSAPDCDLVLPAAHFSETHAYLFLRPGRVRMRRLGEVPEVTLNGRPARVANLCDGDLIGLGDYQLRVRIAAPEQRSEAPAAWRGPWGDAPPRTARTMPRDRWGDIRDALYKE